MYIYIYIYIYIVSPGHCCHHARRSTEESHDRPTTGSGRCNHHGLEIARVGRESISHKMAGKSNRPAAWPAGRLAAGRLLHALEVAGHALVVRIDVVVVVVRVLRLVFDSEESFGPDGMPCEELRMASPVTLPSRLSNPRPPRPSPPVDAPPSLNSACWFGVAPSRLSKLTRLVSAVRLAAANPCKTNTRSRSMLRGVRLQTWSRRLHVKHEAYLEQVNYILIGRRGYLAGFVSPAFLRSALCREPTSLR